MKKVISTILCGLVLSATASATLTQMTDAEMSEASSGPIFPAFDSRQTAVIIEMILNDKMSLEVLTQKINEKLGPLNLEKVTIGQMDDLLRRTNSAAFTDAILRNNLQIVNQMMINRELYNQQQLADAQRRAIIQTFMNAVVNSNLRNDHSLNNITAVFGTLNPYALLQQYPNIISPVYSTGGPNSPNINIIRNQ